VGRGLIWTVNEGAQSPSGKGLKEGGYPPIPPLFWEGGQTGGMGRHVTKCIKRGTHRDARCLQLVFEQRWRLFAGLTPGNSGNYCPYVQSGDCGDAKWYGVVASAPGNEVFAPMPEREATFDHQRFLRPVEQPAENGDASDGLFLPTDGEGQATSHRCGATGMVLPTFQKGRPAKSPRVPRVGGNLLQAMPQGALPVGQKDTRTEGAPGGTASVHQEDAAGQSVENPTRVADAPTPSPLKSPPFKFLIGTPFGVLPTFAKVNDQLSD